MHAQCINARPMYQCTINVLHVTDVRHMPKSYQDQVKTP